MKVAPFRAPNNTPIIGQPVTLVAVQGIRLAGSVHCNCQPGNADLAIVDGEGDCPACGKHFILMLNPTNGQLELRVQLPGTEVPS